MRNFVWLVAPLLLHCSPPDITGPGQLISTTPLTGAPMEIVQVTLDVQLVCTQQGPMRDIKSATASLTLPDGGTESEQPIFETHDRVGLDCTNDEWQRVTEVLFTFTPDVSGVYLAHATLLPEVGTFTREIDITPDGGP